MVKSSNVNMYRLQAAQESIVLLLSLKDQASSLLPGRTIPGDSKTLKITFHGQYYDILYIGGIFNCPTHLTLRLAINSAVLQLYVYT